MAITVSAIVAMSENRCIGKDNDLPWHIPEDLRHFKRVTTGKPIIMGRKTFESILVRLGKPLPDRTNIVVSRTLPPSIPPSDEWEGGQWGEGPFHAPDIETAIAFAKAVAERKNIDEIIIGGGTQIFELALPYTDRIYLTDVRLHVEGDAFFPDLSPQQWQETASHDYDGDPAFTIRTLERV